MAEALETNVGIICKSKKDYITCLENREPVEVYERRGCHKCPGDIRDCVYYGYAIIGSGGLYAI